MFENHRFILIEEVVMMEQKVYELGKLLKRCSQEGVSVEEYFEMETLAEECQQFYGGDAGDIIKLAVTNFAEKQYKDFLKGLMARESKQE